MSVINQIAVRNLVVKSVGSLYADNVYCDNEMTTMTLSLKNLTSDILISGNTVNCITLNVSNALTSNTIVTNSIKSNTYLNLPSASTVTKGVVQLEDTITSTSTITAPTSKALSLVQRNVEIAHAAANRWVTAPGSSNMTYNAGFIGIGTNLPVSTLHVFGEVQVSQGNYLVKEGKVCIGTGPVMNGYKLQLYGDVYIAGNLYITGDVFQV